MHFTCSNYLSRQIDEMGPAVEFANAWVVCFNYIPQKCMLCKLDLNKCPWAISFSIAAAQRRKSSFCVKWGKSSNTNWQICVSIFTYNASPNWRLAKLGGAIVAK